MALGMLVLGIGIGLCMQVLTIIVQSTVDYRDLGVATSGVTFFRTLGSSFGAAVFGTVYTNVLKHTPARLRSLSRRESTQRRLSTPSRLHAYPATQIATDRRCLRSRDPRRFPGRSAGRPSRLRARAVPQGGPAARYGAGRCLRCGRRLRDARGGDSAQQLQVAIARLFQRKGREAIPAIRDASGTTLDASDGWCVGQVHLRARIHGETSLEVIGRRVHVPAAVLEPAFKRAVADGYLIGDLDHLRLTDAGQREIEWIVAAMRAWIAEELADWGAVDDEHLRQALDAMATQFVDEDPELGARPLAAISSG